MSKLRDNIIPDHTTEDIKSWNNFKYMIDNELNYTYEQIDINETEKYIGNLYALFRNRFNIEPKYIYIHIILNGYKSSLDYNGEKLRFKIIRKDALANADSIRK